MDTLVFGLVEKPVFVRRDARGAFAEVVNMGTWESLIVGDMVGGSVIGHHYHAETVVFYYLITGAAHVVTIDVVTHERTEVSLSPGQGFVFRPQEARAITHVSDARFLLMKSRRYDDDAPDLIEYRVT
jgi:dTDP-4-dehydrorhamnose 3,5-epimerase-like enzyme